MAKKLYVGNLSEDTTEDDLLYNFGELGTCTSAVIVRDKTTGRSKGFAFVEMETEKEAREVVKICRGVELDGKRLVVSEAKSPAAGQEPVAGVARKKPGAKKPRKKK